MSDLGFQQKYIRAKEIKVDILDATTVSGSGTTGDIQILDTDGNLTSATDSSFSYTDSAVQPILNVGAETGGLVVVGVDATTAGASGSAIQIQSGTGLTSGPGGNVNLIAQNGGASGDGGNVSIDAGNGLGAGNGGNITLTPGNGGSGSDGTISLSGPVNALKTSVTQITNTTTPVTANRGAGIITTFTQTAAAGAAVTFTVNNTSVVATSGVLVTLVDYSGTITTNGLPVITVDNILLGSFDLRVNNCHQTNALSGICQIAYFVI